MNMLISGGRVIDPTSGFDEIADVALVNAEVVAIKNIASDFRADQVIDARGCIVAPGLVDLAVRLREPGHEHARMLQSELAAAVAGGVTRLVCPPDTDPVLDEPGLVEMLRHRAEKLQLAQVHPLGALTRNLGGETASGALATRMGLAGVPVAAETIALHTIFELMKATGARVHLCRLSSAAGVALVRQAKLDGLRVSCDVSINSLHLTDVDLGYFDSRARLNPPLRQQRDREALQAGLADGTIDALVSDHTPVDDDAKALPFAESEAGATGVELLLSLALKWGQQHGLGLAQTLGTVSSGPARVLGNALGPEAASAGRLVVGAVADICVFDPAAAWTVDAGHLRSQGKHTPFSGYELPGVVRYTVVGGRLAFQAA